MNGILGFIHAINLATNVFIGHQSHAAIECCTYVWLNMGVSKRSFAMPNGDKGQPTVLAANQLAARVRKALLLCDVFIISLSLSIYIYIYIYICRKVAVCVCVKCTQTHRHADTQTHRH
jgi:hypothetical protein